MKFKNKKLKKKVFYFKYLFYFLEKLKKYKKMLDENDDYYYECY